MSDSSSRKIVDSANIYQDFETRFYEWEDGMSSAGFKLELPIVTEKSSTGALLVITSGV